MKNTLQTSLLAQIAQLGGQAMANEVEKRLRVELPSKDGPLGDITSLLQLAPQQRLPRIKPEPLSAQEAALFEFVTQLRKKNGYFSFGANLVHRSVIHFLIFLIVAFFIVPILLPMVTSAEAGEPIVGVIGLVVAIIVGIILFKKVK